MLRWARNAGLSVLESALSLAAQRRARAARAARAAAAAAAATAASASGAASSAPAGLGASAPAGLGASAPARSALPRSLGRIAGSASGSALLGFAPEEWERLVPEPESKLSLVRKGQRQVVSCARRMTSVVEALRVQLSRNAVGSGQAAVEASQRRVRGRAAVHSAIRELNDAYNSARVELLYANAMLGRREGLDAGYGSADAHVQARMVRLAVLDVQQQIAALSAISTAAHDLALQLAYQWGDDAGFVEQQHLWPVGAERERFRSHPEALMLSAKLRPLAPALTLWYQ
jgi:hypothetical protein